MQKGINKRHLFLASLFAVYMFEYMVTLTFIDKGSVQILTTDSQLLLHYTDYVMITLGMISFAILKSRVKWVKNSKYIFFFSNLVYSVGILSLYFIKQPVFYCVVSGFSVLLLGFLGGMVYYHMAMELKDSLYMGRVMGLGASAAMLVQYILQENWDIKLGLPFVLVIGFFVSFQLSEDKSNDAAPQNDERREDDKVRTVSIKKLLICTCLVLIALEVMGTFFDARMMQLMVQESYETYSFYAWPRLFTIFGYLIIGFVGDFKKGKFVPLVTLCVSMLIIFDVFLITSPELRSVNTSIYYIYLGTFIGGYYNLAFWRIAPRTKRPELWACMGRIITGPLCTLLTLINISILPEYIILGIDILMIVICIVVMMINDDLSLKKQELLMTELSPTEFENQYGFTEREKEVFEMFLIWKGNMRDMAKELAISERVLYRHMKKLYEKTGTNSKVTLLQLYSEFNLSNIPITKQ